MRGRTGEPGMADQADLPSHQPFGPKRRRGWPPSSAAIRYSRRRSHGSVPAWRTVPVMVVVVVAVVVVAITLADVLTSRTSSPGNLPLPSTIMAG